MAVSNFFLILISSMKQNSPYREPVQIQSYRHSLSVMNSDLFRHSLASDALQHYNYRDTLTLQNRMRNSLNVDRAEQTRQVFQSQRQHHERNNFNTLRSTLSELEQRVTKARSQLASSKNLQPTEDSDDQRSGKSGSDYKTPQKSEETSTNASSNRKLPTLKSFKQLDAPKSNAQLKGYYLSHLVPALELKDQRTIEHLSMSLKVLRNYQRMGSPTYASIQAKKVNLARNPADKGKKTLIVDIDQTLIHCEEDPSKPYDIIVPIEIENGAYANAYISIRPYAVSFLKRMSKQFQIIAFTASHQSYADVVLDELDPNREYIRHRLYRKNCIQIHENIYAKDLRIINREMSNMVLVDNAPYSYIYQLENGIPILPYYSGEDSELHQLEKYLEQLVRCSDVREVNKQTFRLHSYSQYQDTDSLIKQLYMG